MLEEQIENLKEVGFVFRNQEFVDQQLRVFGWWAYLDPPYGLLMDRIAVATHSSEELGICDNVYCTDFKHLRHSGWYANVARWLAKKSGNESRLKITDITSDENANQWTMSYKIGKLRHELVTPYPHKYAWPEFMLKLLADFATEKSCFFAYEDPEPKFYDSPLVCWLPKDSSDKLTEMFGEKIRMFSD